MSGDKPSRQGALSFLRLQERCEEEYLGYGLTETDLDRIVWWWVPVGFPGCRIPDDLWEKMAFEQQRPHRAPTALADLQRKYGEPAARSSDDLSVQHDGGTITLLEASEDRDGCLTSGEATVEVRRSVVRGD